MSLIETYILRYGNTPDVLALRNRITSAVAKAAVAVLNEDPGEPEHARRALWAQQALASGPATQDMGERMAWGVLSNTTIVAAGNTSTDGDIEFVVNSLINTFAPAAVI